MADRSRFIFISYDAGTREKFRRYHVDVATHSFAGKVRAPEFVEGLDWINVSRPLQLADLRGRLAIIDFWTFC